MNQVSAFFSFVTFSHDEVTTGVRLPLKTKHYTHKPVGHVVVTSVNVVVVQMFFESVPTQNFHLNTEALQTSICAM